MINRLSIIIFSMVFCIQCNAEIFATFNLKIQNHTEKLLKAECSTVNDKNKVFFHNKNSWSDTKSEKIIEPGKFTIFHIGTYCTIDKLLWLIRLSKYISNDTCFTLTISKDLDDNQSNGVDIKWKGADGSEDSNGKYTSFYFYQYTGSFVIDSIKTVDPTSLSKPDFIINGSANFKSLKSKDDIIITSDNLWSPDSGYYLIDITNNKNELNDNKFHIYPPDITNKSITEGYK